VNHIKVVFFATLRDRAGTKAFELDINPGTTVEQLKNIVLQHFPRLQDVIQHCVTAVNREYCDDNTEIPAEAEVALFPPVSGGGMVDLPTVFSITEDEIGIDALLAQITLPSTGAAAIFSGMVRGVTTRDAAHETLYLEYEAYTPMAEAKMRQVADEIRARWPTVEGIAIVQRVGRLYPRTPTVLIACTAAHRDTGVFEAARYGIDRLKEIVPVWKKEVSPDGEAWLEGDYIPKPGE
jgi:molybdopterin synthase catalytic subunit